MTLIHDLAELNRKIFTRWSFIENRKLLLIWCNGISLFYILSQMIPSIGFYKTATLILSIIFIIIEVGEVLSNKKPKTEKVSQDRIITLFGRTITISKKKQEIVEVKQEEPNK